MNHEILTEFRRQLAAALLCAWMALTGGMVQAETEKTQLDYARSRLDAAEKVAEFRLVKELGHPEAFRFKVENGRTVIEADSPAGLIYGAQAVVCDEAQTGRVQRPDFNVGLYTCPGETLATSRQLEWFRDVIFKAAKESGKNPLLIIRDWTLNMDFREQIPTLYENCYSELKHNDETFTSPVPDRRHKQWRDLLKGHVVNLHGPPMDLQPRFAEPDGHQVRQFLGDGDAAEPGRRPDPQRA